MSFEKLLIIKLICLNLFISLVFADDCSVIKDILTQNNVEISWSPSNSTGCCSHEGINCVNDRIVQINFSSKGYSGNIDSLMSLTALQYINLSNCEFTGSIPSSIQNLSNLQFLYVDRNKLTGTIPSEIAIPNLQFIDLSGNQLEGEIPSSLGKVINLQYINLQNNKLSGSIPSSFHSLKNIQSLFVSGNSQLSGEIPVLSDTLKDCNFGSTSLCINGSRSHCTHNIKSCDSLVSATTATQTKTEEPTSDPSITNNPTTTLGPEDFADNPNKPKTNLSKWIAIIFILILIICILILLLICVKRRCQKPVSLDKPVPSHSNGTIFNQDYDNGIDITQDPDASIQIHSLSKPQQDISVPYDDELYSSQTSSFDGSSSQYESISGRSSNYGSLTNNNINNNNNNNKHYSINSNHVYTNSLNRSQIHLNSGMIINPSDLMMEQDLGDIVISSNNGSIVGESSHSHANSQVRLSNVPNYTKTPSSPNLVRMNRYSVINQTSPSGGGKRILTVSSKPNSINDSPKLIPSNSSSPNIDSKRSKHSSTPFPISPYAAKSSSLNTLPKKSYDSKRKSSTGNDDTINNHNTIHVGSSRKGYPYNIEKSMTTNTKLTNYSENTISSNTNSIHSSTPIKAKNRNSIPSVNSKKPSIITKFSSQNSMSMSVSPLANNMDIAYEMPTVSEPINDSFPTNNNRNSINPSIISSNTTNSIKDINNKISSETFPKIVTPTKYNYNSQQATIPEHAYNISSSSDEISGRVNSQLDISNHSPNSISNNTPNNNNNMKNGSNNIYTNSNTQSLENLENSTEKMYLEDLEHHHNNNNHKTDLNPHEEYKEYNSHENNEYVNDNIPDDIREQIEDPQPPNYEEVFSEMYSPYIDTNNDEAIRMQLEMRRIEERQLRMEYLQRQINNPDISNSQRQKYMDALDRLMLE